MKKRVWITGAVVGTALTGMFVLPFALQGKIARLVKEEGHQMLNAQFDFAKLDISLFRDFPQASISLHDFRLKGTGPFVNDTLIQAGEVSVAVNLWSLFGDEGFDITRISVSDTRLHAIVLPDGQVNWDVMKPDSANQQVMPDSADQQEETSDAGPASSFRVKLQQFVVDRLNLVYEDRQQHRWVEVRDFHTTCSGDFSSERTLLKLVAETPALTCRLNGIPVLNQVATASRMDIEADWVNRKFTLKDNSFRLNAIEAGLDGWVALKGSAMQSDFGMQTDLKLQTNAVDFKEILSLVPAIYQTDFASLQTAGKASLQGYVKGMMHGDTLPAFALDLQVNDAMFRYPSLPSGVDHIQINAQVQNPGGTMDLTTLSIQPFRFSIAGNPFHLKALVKTPVSDPDFQVEAKGLLDLGQIKQVYPLKDIELNGKINADMQLAGRMSYIEKKQSHRVVASGTIGLSGLTLQRNGGPDVAIQRSLFTFTPDYLQLSETTLTWGKSDFTFDSRFENYLGYVWKGTTLKGNFNIRSNALYLDEFIAATPEEASSEVADQSSVEDADQTSSPTEDTAVSSGILEVPRNLDFRMNADFKDVRFNQMRFEQVNGQLLIADSKVDMTNLSMNTLGGSVVMNGSYATTDATKPLLKGDFQLNQLEFAQAYHQLNLVQTMAPVFENLKGNFSGRLNLSTQLDQTMSPVLPTLQGGGSLSTRDLSLSGVQVIDRIADALKQPQLKEMTVDDLTLNFLIKDGRIHTEPFDIQMGDYVMNLSGSTGMDQTIDYEGKIKLPEKAGKLSTLTTFDLKIGGTFTSPAVSLDAKSMVSQAVENLADKALQKLNEKFGKDSTAVRPDSVKPSKKEKMAEKALEFLKKLK